MRPLRATALLATLSAALALQACSTDASGGSPASRSVTSGSAASVGTGSTGSSAAGITPADAVCPADHPVACQSGCCPAGTTCGAATDGGVDAGTCVVPPVSTCPSDSPVQCGAGPSCDGGSCALVDQSSFHNDAQLRSPGVFADGRASGAIGFPQNWFPSCVDDVAATAAAAGLPASGGDFSLEAWVRSTGNTTNSARETLVGIGLGSNYVALNISSSGIGLNTTCLVAAPTLTNGQWHLVAATYSGGTATLYQDGVSKGTCSTGTLTLPAGARIMMANDAPSCDPLFGQLDEVRVVRSALSSAQVGQDFAAAHLPLTPDTIGLWLFDEAASSHCCAAGSTCDPAGRCSAAAGGAPACPPGAPVACSNNTCCPTGTSCSAAGCVKSASAGSCPGSSPVSCGDGTCCPTGLSCSGGRCVATNGASSTVGVCPVNTTEMQTPQGHACCPNTAGVTMIPVDSSSFTCAGSGTVCGAAGRAPPNCPTPGFTACNTPVPGACIRAATATPCASGVACQDAAHTATLCCQHSNDTCIGGDHCCAPGTFACPNGTACCPNQKCSPDGNSCDQAPVPDVCSDGSPLCGGLCCPSGTTCNGSSCVASQPVGLFCANGTNCGSVCCPSGTSCLSAATGQCGVPARTPVCGAGFSGACSAAGPCCKDGFACKGTIGSGGFSCVATGAQVARGGPQGVACGTGYCAVGQVCSGGVCCGADHPDACGAICCLPGGGCSGATGSCHCPAGLPVACGTQCCSAGMACDQGKCVPGCASPTGGALVPACGTSCCAAGIACVNGDCACPGDHPVDCGQTCCLSGAACASGTCGCPSGRVSCGTQCCGEGQLCTAGACVTPSSGGGGGGDCAGGFRGSTSTCVPLGPGGSCVCGGSTDLCITPADYAGTGVPYPGSCNPQGGTGCLNNSGTLAHPCCPGLTCKASAKCGGSATGGNCLP